MTLLKEKPRPSASDILPLILGALGSAGIIALYYLVPGLLPIDLILLLVVVGFVAAGYRQGIIRGIGTIVIIYFATGVAATMYRVTAPYVSVILQVWSILWNVLAAAIRRTTAPESSFALGGAVDRDSLAASFGLLTLIIWVALEIVSRTSFKDTHLPRLRILDNLGGIAIHLIVGALVASLLFNTIGYGSLWRTHNKALLRERCNQVLYVHYTAQSFWFPRRPPMIYVYDLNQRP
ncbi:MAG: CvpA family protein [Chloroflexi bacterium]|nr:CvpA family protein [Chloroflexota bacterium]